MVKNKQVVSLQKCLEVQIEKTLLRYEALICFPSHTFSNNGIPLVTACFKPPVVIFISMFCSHRLFTGVGQSKLWPVVKLEQD